MVKKSSSISLVKPKFDKFVRVYFFVTLSSFLWMTCLVDAHNTLRDVFGSIRESLFKRPTNTVIDILVIIFFWLFYSFILSIRISKNSDLLHKRLLTYLNSFIWFVGFSLISYCQIKIGQGSITDAKFSQASNLMQLFLIFLCGIFLVGYAFHIKLSEIEKNRL